MTVDTTQLSSTIKKHIDAIVPELIEFRHDLHRHPEIMYEEHRTSGRIREELERAGIEFTGDLAGGTGGLAHLEGDAREAVGLRADIDALPIHEQSGVPYTSTIDGRMHACGHDGHTAILLGAARVLKSISNEQRLPRPVSFLFQPAEEGGAGAKRMVEDGCLDGTVIGPPIERMYGLHGWTMLPEGVVGSRPGPLLASTDSFSMVIKGRGGHAAMPHTTIDPVSTAATIITTLQQAVSRRVDPVLGGVVSVTSIHAGEAFNVIPGECHLKGTVRALYEDARQVLRTAVHEISSGIARTLGCEIEIDYHEGYPVTCNDAATTEAFHDLARSVVGNDRVEPLEFPVMGGEDFSYYCQKIPSCFFALGLCPPDQESIPSLHHPAFDFNDNAITTGVEMFCRLAMES